MTAVHLRSILKSSILAFFLLLTPDTQAGSCPDVAGCTAEAARRAADGNLADAANMLESKAAGDPQARSLYREAAWLRERRGEIGQALVDYRAMLASAPAAEHDGLTRHAAYLALLLDGRRVAGSEFARQVRFDSLFPSWAARTGGPPSGALESPGAELQVPGGLEPFARTLGIDPLALSQPDAARKAFTFILNAAPDWQSDDLESNPVRRQVLAYLKDWDRLEQFLKREGMLPPGAGVAARQELEFPLLGSDHEVERARKLLSFFGVDYKFKQAKDGGGTLFFKLKGGDKASERQSFLRALGVNVFDENLQLIRLPFRTGRLPLLLGAQAWDEILPAGNGSEPLLQRMIENAGAMRLYVGLASCSDAARTSIIHAVPPSDLLRIANALVVFGPMIDFRDGQLWLPGSTQSWEGLLESPRSDPAAFLSALIARNQGRAMMLYSALASAPPSVTRYFTSSADRLAELYAMLAPYDAGRLANEAPLLAKQDLGRVFRQLQADDGGLLFNVKQGFARPLFHPAETGALPSDPGPTRFEAKDLMKLLQPANVTRLDQNYPPVSTLELYRYIQRVRPGILTDEMIPSLTRDPDQTPVFLDLVWDIDPDPATLKSYLDYCSAVAAAGPDGWNVNRTRSSQALFYLIAAFCHEGVITREQGTKLLADSLRALDATDEAGFGAGLAGFLSGELLPVLAASTGDPGSDDPILRALAGRQQARSFGFEGTRLEVDPSGCRLRRMMRAVGHQSYTPLPALLDIYRNLQASDNDSWRSLAARLDKLHGADLTRHGSKTERDSVAHASLDDLKKKIESMPAPGSRKAIDLRAGISAQLDTELGVTLLTYCYAFSGTPEVDALAFDPNFIRKHRFYGDSSDLHAWTTTTIQRQPGNGLFFQGSLSGLGYQLCNLATADTAQSLGTGEERDMVPVLLFGMRVIPPALRTDRAQEYVALNVRLGREVLARSVLDEPLRRWLDRFLSSIVAPKRRDRVDLALKVNDPSTAAGVLSPSELFLVGSGYFAGPPASAGNAGSDTDAGQEKPEPEMFCPVIDRLRAIVPERGTADARLFHEEVEQYGVLLRRRIGLSQSSFELLDSYERLEISGSSQILDERICDLKIRLAELNYAAGIPAFFAEFEAEPALRSIVPKSQTLQTSIWKLALGQIENLKREDVRGWVGELGGRVPSNSSAGGPAGK